MNNCSNSCFPDPEACGYNPNHYTMNAKAIEEVRKESKEGAKIMKLINKDKEAIIDNISYSGLTYGFDEEGIMVENGSYKYRIQYSYLGVFKKDTHRLKVFTMCFN
jgi:hypothetical protein